MTNTVKKLLSAYAKMKGYRKGLVTGLMALVVFVTTYALIMPAITLSHDNREYSCLFVVHEHTDDCYEEQPEYDSEGRQIGKHKVLICQKADYAVHEHDENCYQTVTRAVDEDGKEQNITEKVLVCQLPEIKEHKHDKDCYTKQKVLTCGMAESQGHTHTDSCYTETKQLVCSQEEHTHTDACYSDVVVGTDKELVCGYDDGEVITPEVWSEPEYSDPIIDDETGEVLEEAQLIHDAELIQEAVVHHHDDSCYQVTEKTERQLTCDKKEHTHDASCYRTERTLSCGLAEGPSHTHTASCYTEQEVLTCKELVLHRHTMDCYEKGPKDESPEEMGWAWYTEDEWGNKIVDGDPHHLICGQIELLSHQHNDACYTVAVDDADVPLAMTPDESESDVEETLDTNETETETESEQEVVPAAFNMTIPVEGADYQLILNIGKECGIPKEATFKAVAIKEDTADYDAFAGQAAEAVAQEQDKDAEAFQTMALFDLSIYDAEGNEIQPQAPISVTIDLGSAPADNNASELYAVHFPGTSLDEDGNVTTAAPEAKETEAEETDETEATETNDTSAPAEPEVKTLEENDGKVNFDAESFSVYAVVYTVDFHWEANGKVYDFSLPGGGYVSFTNLIEVLEIADGEYNEKNKSKSENLSVSRTLTSLDSVVVSDETKEFIANVADVEFSSPELVDVSKLDSDTTVGKIKENRGLDVHYSGELTKKQIEEIDNCTIKAGDWVLISLQPFISTEFLNVTMKNGDHFSIKVTDGQLHTYVISDSGDTYEIIVTYDDSAEIPENAELKVSEISEDMPNYKDLCSAMERALNEEGNTHPSVPALFDISIVCDGKTIEPKEGSEVKVEAKLLRSAYSSLFDVEKAPVMINDEPMTAENCLVDAHLRVLHAKTNGNIEVVNTEESLSAAEVSTLFTTDSFSDWLLYLDEELDSITIGVDDTLTLRPYGEWYWMKNTDGNPYKNDYWKFDGSEWSTSTSGNVTTYTLRNYQSEDANAKVEFKSYSKTDAELNNEQYTVIYGHATAPGTFTIKTQGGKNIQVNVVEDVRDVPPVVTNTSNIKVNLFNYDNTENHVLDAEGNTIANINAGYYNDNVNIDHFLKFLGWGSGADNAAYGINQYTKSKANQGIVQNTLTNDHYPRLKSNNNNQSLKYLFDTTSNNESVKGYADVDGLFQLDENGYYYYNSNSNYAWFDEAQNRFVLYSHTFSQETTGSYQTYGTAVNAKPIGFFPFHRYDEPVEDDSHTGMNYNPLLDHHFGMSMAVEFSIPPEKTAQNGDHIIYEFSGDDDLWVFIDDDLVLDIGGIHQPVRGYIDFTTGDVYVYGKSTTQSQKVLNLGTSKHTLRMFYLERGGCDSNLSVKFNLPLTVGNVSFTKKDEGEGTAAKALRGATFGLYSDLACTKLLATGTSDENGVVAFNGYATGVYYMKETTAPQGYILDSNTVYKVNIVDDTDTSHSSSIVKLNAQGQEIPGNITIITNPEDFTQAKVKKNWIGDQSRIPTDASITVTLGRYKLVPEGNAGTEPVQTGTIIINQTLADDGAINHVSDFKVDYVVKNGLGESVATGSYTGTTGATITGLAPGTYSIESICTSLNSGYYVGNEEQNRSGIVITANGSATVSFSNTLTSERTRVVVKGGSYGNTKTWIDRNDIPIGSSVELKFVWPESWSMNENQNGHFQYSTNGLQWTDIPCFDTNQHKTWAKTFGPVNGDLTIQIRKTGNGTWTPDYSWPGTPTLTVIEPASSSSSPQNLNSRNAVMLKASSPVQTRASNPEPPSGYTIDDTSDDVSGWSKDVILPNGSSWERVVSDLQKVDLDGNIYVYYISSVSENGMSEGTKVSIDLNGENKQVVFGNQTDTGTLSLTNTLPVSSLALKKIVRVNEFDPDTSDVAAADKNKADGEYTFNIVGKAGTETAGKSYVAKIIIGNKTVSGVTHYGVPVSATVNNEAVTLTEDGRIIIPDMVPGEYTVTESQDSDTICIAVACSDNTAVTDVDNMSATVVVPPDQEGVDPTLVTFTNNYSDNSTEDIAHLSVRKTFTGLSADQLPNDFEVKVKVTLSNGEVKNYTLTSSATQPSGITFINDAENTIWNWKIAIPGLNPEATVEVTEVGYSKTGYVVTTSVNGASGTTSSGTISSSTVVQSAAVVETAQNSKKFDVYTNDKNASIFIARVVPTQTAIVISKHKLNLSERAAVEAKLKTMPNAGDWTNNQPVQYYSIEEAQKITVRKMPVTYRDKDNEKGEIEFTGKKQWDMAATIFFTYVPGHPADFNFVNDYTETGVDLDIVKVDSADMETPLEKAQFTLKKLDPDGVGTYLLGNDAVEKTSADTDAEGKTVITGITSGYYEVSETKVPGGYVIVDDGKFYIKVYNGIITRITKVEDNESTPDINEGVVKNWPEFTDNTGKIRFTGAQTAVVDDPETTGINEAREATNAIFTVGNTPGAALPNTGGPGTHLFYIFGAILALMGGAALILRRRTIK